MRRHGLPLGSLTPLGQAVGNCHEDCGIQGVRTAGMVPCGIRHSLSNACFLLPRCEEARSTQEPQKARAAQEGRSGNRQANPFYEAADRRGHPQTGKASARLSGGHVRQCGGAGQVLWRRLHLPCHRRREAGGRQLGILRKNEPRLELGMGLCDAFGD